MNKLKNATAVKAPRAAKVPFEDYLALIVAFRKYHKIPPGTDNEVAAWRADWNTMTGTRQKHELAAIKTHCILSGL